MKTNINLIKGSRLGWFPYSLIVKGLLFTALILICAQSTVKAQDAQYTRPSWFFGGAVGGNFNFYQGTTQELNNDLTVPKAFRHGKGLGLFAAPLIEYHRPNTVLGFMLQVGYDSRKGKFDQVITPCNCPADLAIGLTYITVEPSLRIAPFKSNFYIYGGPRFAFNKVKSFTYNQKINPAYPAQLVEPEVHADLSNVYNTLISMQVGAGIDIPLSSQKRHTQFMLSPFVAFQPYFGQEPRSTETWTITTIRAGIALKFGRGQLIPVPVVEVAPAPVEVVDAEVQFTVDAPKNAPTRRNIKEIFPLRNYVFFNTGSTEIPERYVLLKKDQVADFKEDQLKGSASVNMSGRSKREMIVYYNVLNILGDRMEKNPTSTILLVGSSNTNPKEGQAMAISVKQYLVTVFDINPSRIAVQGRKKPKLASERPGGRLELELLREGDRRVSIESSSPELLMEFQSGPDAPLKGVAINDVEQAPVDSYVSFNVENGKEAFTTWSLEIRDENGNLQNFGPYTDEKVSIPGNSILGTRPEGDYKVTLVGQTKSGKTVKKESTVHIVLWKPAQNQEIMRYSILYEFNNAKAIMIYQRYLADIVSTQIPVGGTVIIHGHTDIIGGEAHNQTLSLARANNVKTILEKALLKAGRSDVKFEVSGSGEDQSLAPFDNKYPEERFYNRTVIIDIPVAK